VCKMNKLSFRYIQRFATDTGVWMSTVARFLHWCMPVKLREQVIVVTCCNMSRRYYTAIKNSRVILIMFDILNVCESWNKRERIVQNRDTTNTITSDVLYNNTVIRPWNSMTRSYQHVDLSPVSTTRVDGPS